jgi:hypothetical protein
MKDDEFDLGDLGTLGVYQDYRNGKWHWGYDHGAGWKWEKTIEYPTPVEAFQAAKDRMLVMIKSAQRLLELDRRWQWEHEH